MIDTKHREIRTTRNLTAQTPRERWGGSAVQGKFLVDDLKTEPV